MSWERGECLHDGGINPDQGHIGLNASILFDVWVGDQESLESILGINFKVLVGLR